MTGEQLFDKYFDAGGKYAGLLMTIECNIGKQIYPLLVEAEKSGKKLDIRDFPEDDHPLLHDELGIDDIILV